MKITWKGDITGLDLHPTWSVESAQVHLVRNFERPDGTREDTFVLHVRASEDQLRKLHMDFGKDSIPSGILGIKVLPIIPPHPIWIWNPPRGYESSIKPGSYTSFEITED